MPFEIGEKFGKVVLGEQMGNVVETITDFYKTLKRGLTVNWMEIWMEVLASRS